MKLTIKFNIFSLYTFFIMLCNPFYYPALNGIPIDIPPYAKVIGITMGTMGIKLLMDRMVPHEKYYSWNYEDEGKMHKRIYGLILKSVIKGLSYGALVYGLSKNSYTKTAFSVGAFGILDSLASLPAGFLSPPVFFLLRKFRKKVENQSKKRMQESMDKDAHYEKFRKKATGTIDKKFKDVCALAQGLNLFIPTSEIAKEDEKSEERFYERMYFKHYANSCGLLNLKKIFKQHNILNEQLGKFCKKRLGRPYRYGNPIRSKNSYEILRDLGMRDIAYKYFLGSDETVKTWNLLPFEIVEYIFSFLNCSHAEVTSLLNYADALKCWKQNKNENKIPLSPFVSLSAFNWARFLDGASITLYEGSKYARLNFRSMDMQISSNMMGKLLNIVNDKSHRNCIRKVNNGIEDIEQLQCRVKKMHNIFVNDIFVYEDAQYFPVVYKEVEVLYSREKGDTACIKTSNKIITIQFSTTNNKKAERIKLEKGLYETLFLLAGPNGIVELAYTFNKLKEICELHSDKPLVREIAKNLLTYCATNSRSSYDLTLEYLVNLLSTNENKEIYNIFFDEKGLVKIYNFDKEMISNLPECPKIGTLEYKKHRLVLNKLLMRKNEKNAPAIITGIKYLKQSLINDDCCEYYYKIANAMVEALDGVISDELLSCDNFVKSSATAIALHDLKKHILSTIYLLLSHPKRKLFVGPYIKELNDRWGECLKRRQGSIEILEAIIKNEAEVFKFLGEVYTSLMGKMVHTNASYQ